MIIAGLVLFPNRGEAHSHGGHCCHHHEEEEHDETKVLLTSEQIQALGIEIKKAEKGEVATSISTIGKIVIHPDKLAHILPKVSGVAREARKNIGDWVEEGEILAILESREIADSKADYMAAKERLSLTLAVLEREKKLQIKKISAEQDYLNAKSNSEEAKINLQLARQKLHAYGIDDKEIQAFCDESYPELRFYPIRSPMNGTIISRHITKGEFIEETAPIYEVADLSRVWVEIAVYPKDLPKVKKGQTVDILLPIEGKSIQAKMIYLSPLIQDETIASKAIAEIENQDHQWRPGSFVNVHILNDQIAGGVVIHKQAIQNIEGKECLFVKVADGFEKREAVVGPHDHEMIQVISGLVPGEEYAASQSFLLKADLGKHEAEHQH